MTLIDRIIRLFRADVHDLLDRIEEPSAVLMQAVRDMEIELHRDEKSIRHLEREGERQSCRLSEIDDMLKNIEAQLDVCFRSGNEDLARRVIKRRLEVQNLRQQSARKGNRLDEAFRLRNARYQEKLARLEEIRRRAESLAEEGAAEGLREFPLANSTAEIRDEDVEVAFLLEKQIRRRP